MADPRKFLYNSDYPIPSFVWTWEGEYTAPSSTGYFEYTIPHGLPFTPLVIGYYSMSLYPDRIYNFGQLDSDVLIWPVLAVADRQNVKIQGAQRGSASSTKFKISLGAFAPPEFEGNTPFTKDITNFSFNSDYDYPKLFMAGRKTLTDNKAIIRHALGYIPKTRVWVERADGTIGMTTLFNEFATGDLSHYSQNYVETDIENLSAGLTYSRVFGISLAEPLAIYYHIYLN